MRARPGPRPPPAYMLGRGLRAPGPGLGALAGLPERTGRDRRARRGGPKKCLRRPIRPRPGQTRTQRSQVGPQQGARRRYDPRRFHAGLGCAAAAASTSAARRIEPARRPVFGRAGPRRGDADGAARAKPRGFAGWTAVACGRLRLRDLTGRPLPPACRRAAGSDPACTRHRACVPRDRAAPPRGDAPDCMLAD